ncbi:Retrotrans gag domain-containing protein, partial [Aphis craccivora]
QGELDKHYRASAKGCSQYLVDTVRILDHTWDEFRADFLQKFNNMDIQSRLQTEIVSVRQTPTQSLG